MQLAKAISHMDAIEAPAIPIPYPFADTSTSAAPQYPFCLGDEHD